MPHMDPQSSVATKVLLMEVAQIMRSAVDQMIRDSKPEIGVLFVLLVGISVALTSFIPAHLLDAWRTLVMSVASMMGNFVGIGVSATGNILTVNGFAMMIIHECTALNYAIILSTAILLYTRHTIQYRIAGVLIAIPIIVLMNAVRLVVSGFLGAISRRAFDIIHDYVWVALFALCIFALWKLWVDRSFRPSPESVHKALVILIGSTVAFSLLFAMMPVYGPSLAYLSSLPLKVFLNDKDAAIHLTDSNLQCIFQGVLYLAPFNVEFLNIAVFAGLALPLQKKDDWQTLSLTLFSFIVVLMINAVLIATMMNSVITHGEASLPDFVFIEKGLLLALPFGLWWILASGSEGKSKI